MSASFRLPSLKDSADVIMWSATNKFIGSIARRYRAGRGRSPSPRDEALSKSSIASLPIGTAEALNSTGSWPKAMSSRGTAIKQQKAFHGWRDITVLLVAYHGSKSAKALTEMWSGDAVGQLTCFAQVTAISSDARQAIIMAAPYSTSSWRLKEKKTRSEIPKAADGHQYVSYMLSIAYLELYREVAFVNCLGHTVFRRNGPEMPDLARQDRAGHRVQQDLC
ncbi:hypothetical protein DFP72DRAFT_856915 [Ephemerocybe angulata]|uniref:Uncharacterized protein n=1 Tax=Ephemerocybe angulata TaxID=980116 RepID=A0A8H6HDU2_9AGAR|nr:hypothetical protein DFP72DRAFT_856915 [Tulosesus angulatus]